MTSPSEPARVPEAQASDGPEPERREPARRAPGSRGGALPRFAVLRVLLGVVGLVGAVALLVRGMRPELEALGRDFFAHFGLWGMAFGTFIADGFHFPLPPQFYMLLGLAAGSSRLSFMGAITAGSLLGGLSGYFVARRLARFPRLARWLARGGRKLHEQLEGRRVYRNVLIASVTPVAFSVLCYLAGLYRLPLRAFGLVLLLRIPKLVIFYYLVRIGWGSG